MNFDVMMSFFILGQHAEYYFYFAGSLNKQSAGSHVVPLGNYYLICGNHYTANAFFYLDISVEVQQLHKGKTTISNIC